MFAKYGYSAESVARSLLENYVSARAYARSREAQLAGTMRAGEIDASLRAVARQLQDGRIGYIVATCSPVTHAHFELAIQAADRLSLDVVFFVLWPFHFIPAFHVRPLDAWVREQQHVPWEVRVEILKSAIDRQRDPRLKLLGSAKTWYEESEANFLEEEPETYYWTGTWYVLRKIQRQITLLAGNGLEFWFICGADQFNPNVSTLLAGQGQEKVWRDYSIAHHLSLHNVFAVPRHPGGADIEHFVAPPGFPMRVVIGTPLKYATVSATQIRFRSLPAGLDLEDYCPSGAAKCIRRKKLWGWQ